MEDLKTLIKYLPDTGEFLWKTRPGQTRGDKIFNSKFAGKKAGCDDEYRKIRVGKQLYLGHRVAWFLAHGCWPEFDIDHKNGNKLDNRLSNLRPASRSQNMANLPCRNKYGLKGVSPNGSNWKAEIMKDGKRVHLGTFKTPEEASDAYNKAAAHLYGDFAYKE